MSAEEDPPRTGNFLVPITPNDFIHVGRTVRPEMWAHAMFIVYKIMAAGTLAFFIIRGLNNHGIVSYWAYFASMNMFVVFSYFVTSAIVMLLQPKWDALYRIRREGDYYVPMLLICNSVFMNMSYSTNLTSLISFLCFMSASRDYDSTDVVVQIYVIPLLFTWIDCFLTAHPYRLQDGWIPFMYLLAYLIWSMIFMALGLRFDGSDHIYPYTDWTGNAWVSVMVCLFLLSTIPIAHFIYWYNWRWGNEALGSRRMIGDLMEELMTPDTSCTRPPTTVVQSETELVERGGSRPSALRGDGNIIGSNSNNSYQELSNGRANTTVYAL